VFSQLSLAIFHVIKRNK